MHQINKKETFLNVPPLPQQLKAKYFLQFSIYIVLSSIVGIWNIYFPMVLVNCPFKHLKGPARKGELDVFV